MASLVNSRIKCRNKTPEPKKSERVAEKQNEMDVLLKQLPVLNDLFRLHNKIGKGTFSNVYLATLRNGSSTQKFAVKHLTQHCKQSRIEYEFKCLRDIGGKDNVVPAELCLTNGSDCFTFIMPYLPHLKFSDYMVDMDAEETRFYMKNLFIALRRVHSFNIIHRDVKPDNFLYNRETKQFLLVDFGLAQVVRIPHKEENQGMPAVDENAPIDYSKKRKRTSVSNEDDEKLIMTPDKRMALKLKDNNIKIDAPKPHTETKYGERGVGETKNVIPSPTKHRKCILEQDKKTPAKCRVVQADSEYSEDRRKVYDFPETGFFRLAARPAASETYERSAMISRDIFTGATSVDSSNCICPQPKDSKAEKKAMPSAFESFASKRTPSKAFAPSCPCSGRGAICSVCKSRNPMCAPRGGTSGFRPPEVLFKYLHQTTAVDMWASGVVLLCILSGCYPFFKSSSDLVSLAEIMTLFGTERTAKIAAKFGRRIICSQISKGVDLKKLCVRLRSRHDKNSRVPKTSQNEPKCRHCFQSIKKNGCLCPSDSGSREESDDFPSRFPDSAYDLLYRLMDLDPTTRITAAEALEHPFIAGP